MAITKLSGKDLYVEYNATNFSVAYKSLEIDEKQETVDATAGADDYRNHINTVKTIEATLEIIMQDFATGGSAILALLSLGGTAPLIWGPQGTATGKPKKGFMARLVEAPQTFKFDDLYTIKAKYMMAGTSLLYDGVTTKY